MQLLKAPNSNQHSPKTWKHEGTWLQIGNQTDKKYYHTSYICFLKQKKMFFQLMTKDIVAINIIVTLTY